MTTVPKPDSDPEYRDELLGYIQRRMDAHPRGKQQLLGPSEIGGCPRGIAWKLSKGAADGKPSGWASAKGVIVHDWLDKEVFADEAPRFRSNLALPQVVPWVAGGTLDLHDSGRGGVVVDFKAPGDPSMTKARRGRPPAGYWVQVNAYGVGAVKLGLPVTRVALLYLPMCGDSLHGLDKGAVLLTWPFDPQVAVDAYKAIERTRNMLAVAPLDRVMESLPTADDFCHSRNCWIGNKHPDAICRGHRVGSTLKVTKSDNPFS